VLDHLEKKPLEASKHTRMLAEKKRIAGILGEDTPKPQPTTINIEEFRISYWGKYAEMQAVEGEVIDTKTGTETTSK